MEAIEQTDSAADEIIDELLPEKLEWRRLVCSYPLPAVALAAAGGFLLGRSRGSALLAALSAFAASQVTRSVTSLVGEDPARDAPTDA